MAAHSNFLPMSQGCPKMLINAQMSNASSNSPQGATLPSVLKRLQLAVSSSSGSNNVSKTGRRLEKEWNWRMRVVKKSWVFTSLRKE